MDDDMMSSRRVCPWCDLTPHRRLTGGAATDGSVRRGVDLVELINMGEICFQRGTEGSS